MASASSKPLLLAHGLSRTFRMGDTNLQILRDVDLTVNSGEFVAIEGRSGEGKSTLLHILGCLDEPSDGTLTFDGQSLSELNGTQRSEMRNHAFGFVFQFYHLLPELTVLENTLLSAMIDHSWLAYRRQKKALQERATALLTDFGLQHRLRHRPALLSGGERQRVAIARALMNRPRILFADEPTGNLDAETGQQIMGVLERLHRQHGQTIVMVTHDRTIARQADRILLLREGKLQAAPVAAAALPV